MRLITNIEYVSLIDADEKLLMRTNTHALLLAGESGISPSNKIRGFSLTGSMPTFDLFLECDHLDYEVERPTENEQKWIADGARLGHVRLRWADGTRLRVDLTIGDWDGKLDVLDLADVDETLKGDERAANSDAVYNGPEGVWTVLPRKVAEHWGPPYMPVVEHRSAELVRIALAASART